MRPRKSKVSETTDNAGTKGKDKEKQEKPKVKTGNNKTVETNLEEKSVESILSKPSLPCKIPLYPLFREDKVNINSQNIIYMLFKKNYFHY